MSSLPQTAEHPVQPKPAERRGPQRYDARGAMRAVMPIARHAGLLFLIVLSTVLNTRHLAQNGYSNDFYSSGVRSMLDSWHNFLFASFDPGGFITIDKPPLALWVQVASAKAFGFSPLSLLLPEALMGVLTVVILYVLLARRLGVVAAFAGGLALAVFPSFVAVSRDNGVDPLLILLMTAACATAVRACETGRWRSLILTGVLVGLGFNTKTLAAYLVVPSIAVGFLVSAPGSLPVRAGKLLVGGLVMLVVSFSWIAFVELTPASRRPWVGSSTNNTELGLTFEYNGLGRVEGQEGGPGEVFARPGARVEPPKPKPKPHSASPSHAGADHSHPAPALSTFLPDGRYRNPIPFGSKPSPVRLFGKGLGDQAGWEIPLALFGLIGLARLLLAFRRGPWGEREGDDEGRTPGPGARAGEEAAAPLLSTALDTGGAGRDAGAPAQARGAAPVNGTGETAAAAERPWRRDRRLATAIVLGGWFIVEATVLSISKGIVHPYYVSALAPATGAMAGAGAVALIKLRRGRLPVWGAVLAACAVVGTVAVQIVLLHRESYMEWFIPVLIGTGAVGIAAIAAARTLAGPAMAATFLLLRSARTEKTPMPARSAGIGVRAIHPPLA